MNDDGSCKDRKSLRNPHSGNSDIDRNVSEVNHYPRWSKLQHAQ